MTKHHVEFLSLKGGCTSPYESTPVKMPHWWKSHVVPHIWAWSCIDILHRGLKSTCTIYIWVAICDFQQGGKVTSVDSDEPVQPALNLRNSKCYSVSNLTVIEYSSDKHRPWSDCEYAQPDLSLCWLHIPHGTTSHVAAHLFMHNTKYNKVRLRLCLRCTALCNYHFTDVWFMNTCNS